MSVREKISSFDRKNLGALVIIGFVSLMFASQGLSQSSGTPDVSFGQNGIQINSGGLDTGGGDITDGSTTVWDASNSYVPATSVDQETIQSGTTGSDVGLGNVRNVDLSNTAGGDISYDSNNEQFNVDSSSIQSGTTASDVGLGNVENIALSNTAGSNLAWDSGNNEFDATDTNTQLDDESATSNVDMNGNDLSEVATIEFEESSFDHRIRAGEFNSDSGSATDEDVEVQSAGAVLLSSDVDGDSYSCYVSEDDGSWNCDGTKSWIHSINSTHDAYYTSQESPEVRAVYEGSAHVVDSKRIELPSHFSKTVSDTEPMLRAQVTPQGTFTKAVVMDKTDDFIEIKVGKETDVDFRITGIRDGYEDKQVVREKEE